MKCCHGALQISDDGANFNTVHEIDARGRGPIWVNFGNVEFALIIVSF